MKEKIANEFTPEWFYLPINDRLRISILINVTDEMTHEDKEVLARYQYMKMTYQDVTRAAA